MSALPALCRSCIQQNLLLYCLMKPTDVEDRLYTLISSLKVCANHMALQEGMLIHAEITDRGIQNDLYTYNALLALYVECGKIEDAWSLFFRSCIQDVVSWSMMIQGFNRHGDHSRVIQLFRKMVLNGFKPDKVTLICILKSYTDAGSVDCGRLVHSYIIKERLERDKYIGTTLINMYTKCGGILDAYKVFQGLDDPNVVACSSMILGYAEHGYAEKAIQLFKEMRKHGIQPNEVTFLCLLKACSNTFDVKEGKELHIAITKLGINLDVLIGSTLVDMYATCGSLSDAYKVFDGLRIRNVVSWSIVIARYQEHGNDERALHLYENMREEGIQADGFIFVSVLKACANLEALEKGKSTHAELTKVGLAADMFVGSTLVDMYIKCGRLDDARTMFKNLFVKDVVAWSALISGLTSYGCGDEALNVYVEMKNYGTRPNKVTLVNLLKACSSTRALDTGKIIHFEVVELGFEVGSTLGNTLVDMYAKCSSLEDAYKMFDNLVLKDIVSWNTMIGGYVDNGYNCRALELSERLEKESIMLGLDEYTILAILKACSNMAALDRGRSIHSDVAKRGFEEELVVCNGLINMYAKCGSLNETDVLFKRMPNKTGVSWNALICAYAEHGNMVEAKSYFETMQNHDFGADEVTFISLLAGCNHGGLIEEGFYYLQSMINYHALTPTIQHYICMLDILGRVGCIDEAERVVLEMPFEPNYIVWITFLSSCEKHEWLEAGMCISDYFALSFPNF